MLSHICGGIFFIISSSACFVGTLFSSNIEDDGHQVLCPSEACMCVSVCMCCMSLSIDAKQGQATLVEAGTPEASKQGQTRA